MKSLRNVPTEKCHQAKIQKNADLPNTVLSAGSYSLASIKTNDLADRIRSYFLNVLFFVLTCHGVFGEIKNGYGDIRATKESVKILREMLVEDMNIGTSKRRKIEETIGSFEDYISLYELTQGLLSQFEQIAPELYAQLDTITDRLGRQVDVHVQFVRAGSTTIPAEGSTYANLIYNDVDACQSEHGAFTVSVKIWIVPRALEVLAHEFGHIRYMVPNFASYINFFKSHYNDQSELNLAGHHSADPSGHTATQFAKSFQKNYSKFLKMSVRRPHDPPTLLARLRKEAKTM